MASSKTNGRPVTCSTRRFGTAAFDDTANRGPAGRLWSASSREIGDLFAVHERRGSCAAAFPRQAPAANPLSFPNR